MPIFRNLLKVGKLGWFYQRIRVEAQFPLEFSIYFSNSLTETNKQLNIKSDLNCSRALVSLSNLSQTKTNLWVLGRAS